MNKQLHLSAIRPFLPQTGQFAEKSPNSQIQVPRDDAAASHLLAFSGVLRLNRPDCADVAFYSEDLASGSSEVGGGRLTGFRYAGQPRSGTEMANRRGSGATGLGTGAILSSLLLHSTQ